MFNTNEIMEMYCPVCKERLYITGKARMETLSEHVENVEVISKKDKYECLNDKCQAYNKVFWNFNGETYTNRQFGFFILDEIDFINGNNAPFGSFQRKMNVEILKHDEDFYLFKKWFGGFSLKVMFKYKSNENGDIIKRKPYLQWYQRDKDDMFDIYLGKGILGFTKRKKYGN